MLATGQNSSNCQEESCAFPVADNYFNHKGIYSLCQEEAGNMTLCACGCGQEIVLKAHHRWRGTPKYISGHNPSWNKGLKYSLTHEGQFKKGNVPLNKGRPLSEETKKKLSETLKGYIPWNLGKPHSEETKQRISQSRKGQLSWNKDKLKCWSEETLKKMSESRKGQVSWNKGISHTKETCTKISKARIVGFEKGRIHTWNKGKKGLQTSWMKGRHHSEESKRKISESHKGLYDGEKNPSWNGGISFEPYCPKFNNKLKEQIRDRDNRTCQLCGIKENGKKLDIHHVHYDKPNCEPDLIALCHNCHCKTTFNRDYYELLFMERLTIRGLI